MNHRTIVNLLNTHKIFIQCLDVCVQVCMCSSVGRNLLKINLQVWFHFIVFLRSFKYKQQMVCKTILCNIYKAGHTESSVLLSPSASCYECIESMKITV